MKYKNKLLLFGDFVDCKLLIAVDVNLHARFNSNAVTISHERSKKGQREGDCWGLFKTSA